MTFLLKSYRFYFTATFFLLKHHFTAETADPHLLGIVHLDCLHTLCSYNDFNHVEQVKY